MTVTIRTEAKWIPYDQIYPGADNPRREAGDVSELSASIKENGLEQWLLVIPDGTGRYKIEDGYRRWVASKPHLRMVPCIVRFPTEDEDLIKRSITTGLITDLKEKLNPIERAKAYGRLRDEYNMTQDAIAKLTGVKNTTVSRYLMLLLFTERDQEKISRGTISVERAIDIIKSERAKNRKKTGKRQPTIGWEPDAFTESHHLAPKAAITCDARGHNGRRRFAGACHACWEHTIRQDEAKIIAAQLKAANVDTIFLPPVYEGASTMNQVLNRPLHDYEGEDQI